MRFFAKAPNAPRSLPFDVERWSAAELATAHAYLAAFRDTSAVMSKDDHLRLATYLVQRYYPAGQQVPRDKWDRFLARCREGIEKYYDVPIDREALKAGYEKQNVERAERDRIARESYRIRPAELHDVIFPVLSAYGLLRPEYIGDLISAAFDPAHLQTYGRTETAMNGLCEVYSKARCFQNAAYPNVRISAQRCPCVADLHKRYIPVSEILESFANRGSSGIVRLIMTSRCLAHETPAMCRIGLLPAEADPLPDDPEFERYLDSLAKRSTPAAGSPPDGGTHES